MLLSLLCHHWAIALLLCCPWDKSIGFWHYFNKNSIQLCLCKWNVCSVSEVLSTCSSLSHPTSWTFHPHVTRLFTTLMSTTRISSGVGCLFCKKSVICSELKKNPQQNPFPEHGNNSFHGKQFMPCFSYSFGCSVCQKWSLQKTLGPL